MKEQLKAIAPLVAAVRIEGVRLLETRAETRIESPNEAGEVDLLINTRTGIKKYSKGDSTFAVFVGMETKLIPRSAPDTTVVSITAKLELRYSLPEDFVTSQKELKIFAGLNGVFNAWPYLREYVQSTTARMNLPPIVIPVFRVQDQKKPGTSAPSPKSQESASAPAKKEEAPSLQ